MYIYIPSHIKKLKKKLSSRPYSRKKERKRERKKNCDGAFDSRSVAEEEGEKRLHGT